MSSMTFALAGALVVLALIDSTSFGTLLIPIWLLLAPGRIRVGRVLVFLGTVAGVYLLLGVALVAGASALLGDLDALAEDPVVTRVQLVVGVGLLVGSFFIGGKKKDGEDRPRGRLLGWRERAMGTGSGIGGLMTLALAAVALEVVTMLPYLAATGLIASTDLGMPARVVVLAGYCLVMILPALVLMAGRLVARRAVEPVLERLSRWMERHGGETTGWIVGIVGFLVARDAVGRMPELISFLDAL